MIPYIRVIIFQIALLEVVKVMSVIFVVFCQLDGIYSCFQHAHKTGRARFVLYHKLEN